MAEASEFEKVKGTSAPARRALDSAGFKTLSDLTQIRESDLAKLHGMGPKAIVALREALAERGLNFKTDVS